MGAAGAKPTDAYLGAEQKAVKCSQLCCSPFATQKHLNPSSEGFSGEGWNPSEKCSILQGVGAGWGDGASQDRTSRIGAWFAEILEELIQFVVVCLCLSLSGTSFTDIPVYCWQLLLNKIIFSLPSRSFSYFWRFDVQSKTAGWWAELHHTIYW